MIREAGIADMSSPGKFYHISVYASARDQLAISSPRLYYYICRYNEYYMCRVTPNEIYIKKLINDNPAIAAVMKWPQNVGARREANVRMAYEARRRNLMKAWPE